MTLNGLSYVSLCLLLQLLHGDRQKACRNLLKDYYSSLCKHLLNDCRDLRGIEKQNRRILQVWPNMWPSVF